MVDIPEAIHNGEGYSVLTMTRDRIPLKLKVGEHATPEWEYAAQRLLNDVAVVEVLNRISQILQDNNDRPIFVVFNEYFFSKELTHRI